MALKHAILKADGLVRKAYPVDAAHAPLQNALPPKETDHLNLMPFSLACTRIHEVTVRA